MHERAREARADVACPPPLREPIAESAFFKCRLSVKSQLTTLIARARRPDGPGDLVHIGPKHSFKKNTCRGPHGYCNC